jgi:hypothetical protein
MSDARLCFTGTSIARLLAPAALLLIVTITGCSKIQVKLGTRVSLAKIPMTSMEATLPNGSAIAPGEKSPLVVSLTGQDGNIWETEGKGKGKILWKDLTIMPTVVSVNNKGVISLPRDPRVSDGKIGHIDVTAPSQPTLHASLDIPLRYDYPFTSTYAGVSGNNGTDGMNGAAGFDGTPGSLDPNNPSPGSNGSNGTDGTAGSDGGDGNDGPPLQVRVALRPGTHPLLQIGVSAPGHKERFYLVDPQGGSLTVRSNGGDGGKGGKGGQGGRGGSGGIGTPNGNDGSNGMNGSDGRNGSPGNPGKITITYDPQTKPYLAAIHLPNQNPKPIFNEQPVAPLW